MNSNKIKTFGFATVVAIVLIAALSFVASIGDAAGSVILPENKNEPFRKFGGITLANSNADGFDYKSCLRQSSSSVYGKVSYSSSKQCNSIFLNSPEANKTYHYWDLNLDVGENDVFIDSYSYMTVDFDLDMSEMYDEYRFLTVFRNASEALAHHESFYIYFDYDESTGNYLGYFVEKGVKKIFLNSNSSRVHVTSVYYFNQEKPSDSVVNFYINGIYVGNTINFLDNDASYARAFRIYCYNGLNVTDNDVICIENYQINVFELGYEGAINNLFNNADITLDSCY